MAPATISAAARTISQVAEELGVRDHRVEYATLKYGIKEAFRVGRYRMYTDEQVEAIRKALEAIG